MRDGIFMPHAGKSVGLMCVCFLAMPWPRSAHVLCTQDCPEIKQFDAKGPSDYEVKKFWQLARSLQARELAVAES
jgi:hypothetical protein